MARGFSYPREMKPPNAEKSNIISSNIEKITQVWIRKHQEAHILLHPPTTIDLVLILDQSKLLTSMLQKDQHLICP